MHKLSRQGFADEVNRRVRVHPSYCQGNRIRLHPDGSTEQSAKSYAYDYWGNGTEAEQKAMFSQVEEKVRAEFEVEAYESWAVPRDVQLGRHA